MLIYTKYFITIIIFGIFSNCNNDSSHTRDIILYIRNDTNSELLYYWIDDIGENRLAIQANAKEKIFYSTDSYNNNNIHYSCAKLLTRFDSKLESDSFRIKKDIYNDELWDVFISKNGSKKAHSIEKYIFTVRKHNLVPKQCKL